MATDIMKSAQQGPWGVVDNIKRERETKMPVPDLTYGSPILTPNLLGIDKLARGLGEVEDVANFMLEHLKAMLSEQSLVTSPSTGLRRLMERKKKHIRTDERLCFPWAIVEFKRDGDSKATTSNCYYQAANGTAVALDLQTSLMHRLDRKVVLYPLVAFTCIGSQIKVWITYNADTKNEESREDTQSGRITVCDHSAKCCFVLM